MSRGSRYSTLIALLLAAVPIILLSIGGMVQGLAAKKTLADSLSVLPYFLLAITAFLGAKMHQTSTVFCSSLFALAYLLVFTPLNGVSEPSKFRALAIAIPISLSLMFFIPSSKWISKRGLLLLTATLAPLALLLLPLRLRVGGMETFLAWQPLSQIPNWRLPDLSLVLAQVYGATLFWQKDRELRRFCIAAFFGLFPFLFFLNLLPTPKPLPHLPLIAGIVFSGIGALLLYSMYRMYWQKIYLDELTELPNRRALETVMQRLGKQYAIAMVDIDFFKKFNDTYGHLEGDNVLRFVAFHLARESDKKAFRYGGEEFCLIFERQDADEVFPIVEKARKSLAEKNFYIRAPKHVREKTSKKDRQGNPFNAPCVHVTVSIGLASANSTLSTPEAVRAAADRALYDAKRDGRNRVTFWLEEDEKPRRKQAST